MLLTGIPGDLALAHLANMYESRFAGGALDYGGFHTPRLDSLFAHTHTAPDADSLRDAWRMVQQELRASVPAAWIYHSRGVQGISTRLRGVTMDLRGEMVTVARWNVAGNPGGR